ncbi:MAG: RNA polymerase sigma factor [Magnetococcales bacterium]|nr:RNA polymerase sigma factor [Magnetococcales bacterium]
MDKLAQQAQQGDQAAFASLLESHYERIHRLCYRWTGHTQDAEDLAQEVCITLARAITGYRGECAFATWVYRITLNTARDYHRSQKRRGERERGGADEATAADPAPDPERALISRLILHCISLLPEPLRGAVLLVHAEGLNHRQAGETLECAEGTISWRLSEARKNLATCLEQGG